MVAYRVYKDEGQSSDERGTYSGWPDSHDEWIPLMSRRIAPHLTKSTKARDTIDTDVTIQQDMYRTAGNDAFARARQDSQTTEELTLMSSELTTLHGTNKF